MSYGISIYFGLDNTKEENLNLLKKAHELGFSRIFTSLHIPEANYYVLKKEVKEFLKIAKEYNMDVISDISPNTFKFLDLENKDLLGLKNMGIKTIRIDYGYNEEEIATMSKNPYEIKVQINASTVTEEFFKKLDHLKPNYENMDSLHNFYPRRNTGISEEDFLEKNKLLQDRGIEVSAFVQSNNRRRGPIKEGLPTLEEHRDMKVKLASKHLFALGADSVFIGDSLPSFEELKELSKLNKYSIDFSIKLKYNEVGSRKLLEKTYTSRPDNARDAIRASESRLCLEGNVIEKCNCIQRRLGDITIDNKGYKRYMGELQILKTDLDKDERVNVVASVEPEEFFLFKYVKNGKKFSFTII